MMGAKLCNANNFLVDENSTDKLFKELEDLIYYGLPIKRHPDSVDLIMNVTWAIYYQAFRNENPKYEHCPPESDSWCNYRRRIKKLHEQKLAE